MRNLAKALHIRDLAVAAWLGASPPDILFIRTLRQAQGRHLILRDHED